MIHTKRRSLQNPLRILPCMVLFLLLTSLFGCSKKTKNEIVNSFKDKREVPTLHSEDVVTLISDSGVTQYRISAKWWDIYDKASEPYWYFPKKIFVEKFDTLYRTEASIKGDTAYFYSNKKLWRLVGNIDIFNTAGDRFQTEELFWDQRSQKIYSDKFIHIEKQDVILEGTGFESNEQMTKYVIRNTSGIFPIEKARKDTLPNDSLKNTSTTKS